jgi:hypothetical protein
MHDRSRVLLSVVLAGLLMGILPQLQAKDRIQVQDQAQDRKTYRPMDAWTYEDDSDRHEFIWSLGTAVRNGKVQSTKMNAFRVCGPLSIGRYVPQPMNWVEWRLADGRWAKAPCDLFIFNKEPSHRAGNWESGWMVVGDTHGEITGYRLFVDGGLFGEEYFPMDDQVPFIRIWEPEAGKIAWSVMDADLDSVAAFANHNWSQRWQSIGGGRDVALAFSGTHLDPAQAKHPVLLRVSAYRRSRRFVCHYLVGKGYVSGPKEAGGPDHLDPW